MKIVNRILPIVLLFSIVFFTACKEDEDCVAPEASENIIGSWSLHTGGEVEFESDGTLLDPNGSLIAGGVNGVLYDQKSYKVTGDTLTLYISPPSFNDTISNQMGIAKNLCDTMWVSQGPFAVIMTRID